ncbi:MAG TPA: HD-GYP domain-containing protein [Rhodocyclaceae bacterium]|nr:HD-GYP domain-containing protein [Rhodocyclaceae bacterium]
MLKKIPVEKVRVGMYIQEFCGSWMDHPFWRGSFVLKETGDLRRIRESGVREVRIDTSKGLDVTPDVEEVGDTVPVVQDSTEAKNPAPAGPASMSERSSMQEEIKRAARTVAKAKEAVASMFQEARMGKALDANDALPLVEEISSSVFRNPGALISIARLKNKDEYTYMHSVAVCALMVALARQMGQDDDQAREAGLAGLVHDVGKMMIPDAVLNKPGKLTDEEFALVKRHPEEGHKLLLEGQNIVESTLDVCLHHHEKMDGTGYPHRLPAEKISVFARMGAVCDVYDAVTSNRPYKSGWDPAESLKRMAEWKGHFDERIFQAFVRSLGIYPIGSLVRMESGRLAVVVEQSEKSLLTPRVRAFFSTKSGTHLKPELIDLARANIQDRIIAREDPAKWGIQNLERMWMDAA